MTFYGQAGQDKFVSLILNGKRDGWFLEIGSNDPVVINNTYALETHYNWKGIMIEYDSGFLKSYQTKRPNSVHIIQDATAVDYKAAFERHGVPHNVDYLQIDLEVSNRSTLATLEILGNTIMPTYRFATITFEHDIYTGDYFGTRDNSRFIFDAHGYLRVFSDVMNGTNMYEDWYVHPDLVDMSRVSEITKRASTTPMSWKDALQITEEEMLLDR